MPPPPPPPMPAMPVMPPSPDPVRLEENGEMFTTPQSTGVTVLMNVIMTVTHMLLGAVVLSAFLFANLFNGSSLTQHIYLCVAGYIILMSQAILTFSPHNGWANALKYPRKRVAHWIMQISGSTLAIAGSIVRLTDLANHFQTAHGALGIIAMILTVVSLVGGIANLIFPKQMSTSLQRTLHACAGSITISVAFICLCFAFNIYYREIMGDENANICIALTVVALVGSLTSVLINMNKRAFKR